MSLSTKNCFNCAERFSRANCFSERSQMSDSNSCRRTLDALARNDAVEFNDDDADSSFSFVHFSMLAAWVTGSTSWRLVTTYNWHTVWETRKQRIWKIWCEFIRCIRKMLIFAFSEATLAHLKRCSDRAGRRCASIQFLAQINSCTSLHRWNCVFQIVVDGCQWHFIGTNSVQRCLNLLI